MYNPLTRHLNQHAMIQRCPGGSLSGTGQYFNFTSGGPFLGGHLVTIDGRSMLGNFDQGETTAVVFDFDGTSQRGVYIQFQFYELDSWDGEHLYVDINGTKVDIGSFMHNRASDNLDTTGQTDGIYWTKYSAAQKHMSGTTSHWQDQLHYVRMLVPQNKINAASQVTVQISTSLNQSAWDESWAIDEFIAREAYDTDLYYFDHSTFTSEWTAGTPTSVNGTSILAGFDFIDSTTTTITNKHSSDGMVIEFDFYELDSWDHERFEMIVNGTLVSFGTFQVYDAADNGIRSGESGGIYWYKEASAAASQLNNYGWVDQKHSFKVLVSDATLGNASTVDITFRGSLSNGATDESWGIDTVRFREATATDKYTYDFYKSNTGFAGATPTIVDGELTEGSFWGNQATWSRFNYDQTADQLTTGVVVQFDFYEIDSWDAEEFYALVHGQKISFGNFQVNNATDNGVRQGESNGIYWTKMASDGQTQLNNAAWLDQKHTIKMYIPDDKLLGRTTVAVALGANLNGSQADESWAVDNFIGRAANLNDEREFFLYSSDRVDLRTEIENLAIGNEFATTNLSTLWDLMSTNLAQNTGLIGTINKINGMLEGKSLEKLDADGAGTANIIELMNAVRYTLGTWSNADGFKHWSDKLWDAVDSSIAPTTTIVDQILFTASVLSNIGSMADAVKNGAIGNGAYGAATTFVGLTANLAAKNSGGDFVALPDSLPKFTLLNAFEAIHDQLIEDGRTWYAEQMDVAIKNAFNAYGNFTANAALASMLTDLKANEGNARVDQLDFAAIEELGFTVTGKNAIWSDAGQPYLFHRTWNIEIRDGARDLETDYVKYTLRQTGYKLNNDIYDNDIDMYNFDVI